MPVNSLRETLHRTQQSLSRSLNDLTAFTSHTAQTCLQRTHRTFQHLRRRLAPVAKAAGILATISFAGASLWYTVEGAKYAKCQLELAKWQYCESLGILPNAGADDQSNSAACYPHYLLRITVRHGVMARTGISTTELFANSWCLYH
jgi:hypothetical protein